MHILGVSAFYHDSAACLVTDGEIIAAAQEERFTRKKHDASFPKSAVEYCLAEAGIGAEQLDLVAFYDKPLLKFDRLLETYLSYWPTGFKTFSRAVPAWLEQKLHTPREIDRGLGGKYRGRYVFLEHHESHAASAFFPSPFERAAIVTLDGVGEWATGSIALGEGRAIELLAELRFPHSLGLLYSAFTYFTGFKVNSGEYKLMGLAPYGQPIYRDLILNELLDLKLDGSFRLNMAYFGYGNDDVMTSWRMARLFGGEARAAEAPITQREMDIAASIQAVTEEVVLRIARHAHALTSAKQLVMAGGVALNCVANGRLLREGPFEQLWVQPAAGDAGGALGAALFVWHQLLEQPRAPRAEDRQRGSLLGPAYADADVRRYLDANGAVYSHYASQQALVERIAELLASGCAVGHCAGRMEFGPRALGARSILADARAPGMQRTLNMKIKFRETFRPFAPAVLQERAHEYFELEPDQESPYMLLVAAVSAAQRTSIPAVTHVDDSARIQTVTAGRFPRLHAILSAFERRTGCPVLVNTSFNVRGEPIVNTPGDAYRCFMATELDALVIENALLLRAEQPAAARVDGEAYRAAWAPD